MGVSHGASRYTAYRAAAFSGDSNILNMYLAENNPGDRGVADLRNYNGSVLLTTHDTHDISVCKETDNRKGPHRHPTKRGSVSSYRGRFATSHAIHP